MTELAYELCKAGVDLPKGILSQQEFLDHLLPILEDRRELW